MTNDVSTQELQTCEPLLLSTTKSMTIDAFKQELQSCEQILSSSADRSQKIYQRVEGWVIEYPEFTKLVDGQMHTFWPHDEPEVDNDVNDLRVNISAAEREAITFLQLLFTHYELRAGDDYWIGRIARRFKRPEFQRMATMFAAVEMNSHAPFYNKGNEVLYLDNAEFYSKWRTDPILVDRMAFIEEVVGSADDLISIGGFTFIEGAVLYANFAFFKHFQAQECGKDAIKNFCRGINLSVGDENTHAVGGALLFRRLLAERKLTKEQLEKLAKIFYQLAAIIYEHEAHIIDRIFSFGHIDGITAKNMKDFIKHRINLCLNNLGLEGCYNEEELDGFIASWFYKNIAAIQFHDFFTGGGSEYDSNWSRDLFGTVFDPEHPDFYQPIYLEGPKDDGIFNDLDKYIVFGKDDCRFCTEVKEILLEDNITAEFNMIGENIEREEYLAFMQEKTGLQPTTVPQVFRKMLNGDLIYVGGGEAFVLDLAHLTI